jgi:5-enolpyruvylshikimate-3-phosphate synthase
MLSVAFLTFHESRYVRMTCSMMNEFGCGVQREGDCSWTVPCSGYSQHAVSAGETHHSGRDFDVKTGASGSRSDGGCSPSRVWTATYTIEPDASSASYFLAMAAVTGECA